MIVKVYQKNDFELPYQLMDETETPIDLTGLDVLFVVAPFPGGSLLIKKRIGAGVDVVNHTNGDIKVILTQNDTDLPPRTYIYEIAVIDVDGHRYTALKGWLEIEKSISKEVV